MIEYITLADAEVKFGLNWANGNESMAIMLSNAWLSAKPLQSFDIVPEPVKEAGFLIAEEYLRNNIFQARTEGVVVAKAVKAGDVSSSKTYASGSDGLPMSQGEIMALVLIEPYLSKGAMLNVRVNRG